MNLQFIPYFRPCFDLMEEEAVLRVLKSGWLTTGAENTLFEMEFSKIINSRCISVNSATSGLHLALESIGIERDEKVIIPSYTFTASAEVVRYFGAHPVFVDIMPGTYHMDIFKLELLLSKEKNVKAIMPVNIGGYSMFTEYINEIAKEKNIKVLEDAAHSFPARDKNNIYCGTKSDIGVYSFYANKNITTGEGGLVFTKDESALNRMKTMRLHGISRDVFDRYTSKSENSWVYDVIAPGFKYNMTDIAAAIGRAQLKKADYYMQKRRAVAKKYTLNFLEKDYLEVPVGYDSALYETNEHSWHLYSLKFKEGRLKINRDEILKKLLFEYNIACSVHFIPLHTFTYYKNKYSLHQEDFPVSYNTFLNTISLPIFPDLKDEEIQRIIDAVIDICEKNLIVI